MDLVININHSIESFCLQLKPFIHNVEKWSNILQKSYGVNTGRFLSIFGHFST